jgi:hypothetical protein
VKRNLISYLKRHSAKHQIDYKKINDIKIYQNKQKRLLQMADCCCSALGQALKNNSDDCCQLYKPLLDKSYNKNGVIYNNGFKFVPPHSVPTQFKLIKEIGYKEKKTPVPTSA